MRAYRIKTNKSDSPYLVTAEDVKSAVDKLMNHLCKRQNELIFLEIESIELLKEYTEDHIVD